MNTSIEVNPHTVLSVVEAAFDENGVSNYGCFKEVFNAVQVRASLLERMTGGEKRKELKKATITLRLYEIVTSLPPLHDQALSQKLLRELDELMPLT